MSFILKLASIRCFRHLPVRGVRCYNGLNLSLKLPVLSRINYIVPRSPEIEPRFGRAPGPYGQRVPDGFELIYYFREQNAIRLASMGAAVLALLTVWSLYIYKTEPKDLHANDEKKGLESESSDFGGMRSWWGNLMFRSGPLEITNSDKIYNFIILPFIIVLLIYSRTRVVLWSYRRHGEYMTSITKRFGFGYQIVNHGPGEVIYYPYRKIYKHELQGQRILLFPEYFINSEEEQIMCVGNDLDSKRDNFQKSKVD